MPCAECIDCGYVIHSGHDTWFVHLPSGKHKRTMQAPKCSRPWIRCYLIQFPRSHLHTRCYSTQLQLVRTGYQNYNVGRKCVIALFNSELV